jgi:hypothetical protein
MWHNPLPEETDRTCKARGGNLICGLPADHDSFHHDFVANKSWTWFESAEQTPSCSLACLLLWSVLVVLTVAAAVVLKVAR